jgi:hypothetical protein
LKPGGVFVGNLIGSLGEQNPSFLFSEMKTFKSVYPNSYFFAVSSPVGLYLQNVILVGYNSDVPLDLKKEKEGFLGTIAGHAIDLEQYDLRKHPVFTDDYAPVEYFIARRIE